MSQQRLVGHDRCSCCAPRLAALDRRRFLGRGATVLGAGALIAFAPSFAVAQYGSSEAMVLSCIDPRIIDPVHAYMAQQGLSGKYSQFVIAGAAVGAIAPKFEAWHKTFWQNLAASIQLHSIKRLIVIDHRDCGAAKLAYGEKAVGTPEAETKTHQKVLAQIRAQTKKRHPELPVDTGLMALDGSIQMFA